MVIENSFIGINLYTAIQPESFNCADLINKVEFTNTFLLSSARFSSQLSLSCPIGIHRSDKSADQYQIVLTFSTNDASFSMHGRVISINSGNDVILTLAQYTTKKLILFYLGIENGYYNVGQWAVITGFSRFLWNASTDYKNCFIEKNFDTNRTQTGRVVTFGKVTSSHQHKTTLFFYLSVQRGQFKVLPVDQLAQSGVQNIGFVHTSRRFFLFFEFQLETGEFKEREKRCFLEGQKQANMAIFVARPQVSLAVSQGFYKRIFDTGHVAPRCVFCICPFICL